jgi:FemAB-related protein (PEP-CTERM system-associated)
LWAWRETFKQVFGHDSVYLSARRHGVIVGVLPLVLFRSRLFGRSVVSVPFLNYGGLLIDAPDVAQALVQRAREVGRKFRAAHVELRHTRRQVSELPYRQHKIALVRTLPATVDALWTETDRKVRNQVRKAQKERLVPVVGGAELVDEFYRVFAENMRDLGTPVYSKRLFQDVLARFAGQARVFLVRRDGQTMAAAIAMTFRDTVLVPWASSLREFRHLCPNMLLYWAMLERAVQDGMKRFDFGRSTPGAGTHQFKLQWGASETPLYWEYLLLTRSSAPDHGPANPKFTRAIDLWRRCPLWLTNAVGPHIVRGIP